MEITLASFRKTITATGRRGMCSLLSRFNRTSILKVTQRTTELVLFRKTAYPLKQNRSTRRIAFTYTRGSDFPGGPPADKYQGLNRFAIPHSQHSRRKT